MPKIANRRLSIPQDKLNLMSWPNEPICDSILWDCKLSLFLNEVAIVHEFAYKVMHHLTPL